MLVCVLVFVCCIVFDVVACRSLVVVCLCCCVMWQFCFLLVGVVCVCVLLLLLLLLDVGVCCLRCVVVCCC